MAQSEFEHFDGDRTAEFNRYVGKAHPDGPAGDGWVVSETTYNPDRDETTVWFSR